MTDVNGKSKAYDESDHVCPRCGEPWEEGQSCIVCLKEFERRRKPEDMTPYERAVELASWKDVVIPFPKVLERVSELVGEDISHMDYTFGFWNLVRGARGINPESCPESDNFLANRAPGSIMAIKI